MQINGRQLALRELSSLRKSGAQEFPSCIDRIRSTPDIDSREASLAERIFIGTFQNRDYLDYCILDTCGKKYKSVHPLLKDILRLSAYQIIFLDRIPNHAAVNEAVNLARKKLNPGAASLANAVLRKLASKSPDFCDLSGLQTVKRFSVLYSHPEWFCQYLVDRVGPEKAELFLSLDNTPSPIWLQMNKLRIDNETFLQRLGDNDIASGFLTIPYCVKVDYLSEKVQELLSEGLAYVQDLSARMVAFASDVKPGDTVLDTCAAPGGKSFSSAIAMEGRGRIISSDVSEKRLATLKENAERLSLDMIETRCLDASNAGAFSDISADVVLVDAPCSGFGTIRKKPEIRSKLHEEFASLHELQLKILTNASTSVVPGGTLIYSTCTIFQEENENVVEAFLQSNDDFVLSDFVLPDPFGNSENGMFTVWPWMAGSDGFFIAKLRRK